MRPTYAVGRVLPRGAGRLLRWGGKGLSEEACRRLKWMQHYERRGRNAALTCRHFDISRQTFYRWWRRFDRDGPLGLEGRSRRPRRLRRPTWDAKLEQAVLTLRRQYPRWGKDKLVVLLRRQGRTVSTSMVGRILRRLCQRGVLVEPARRAISTHKRPPRPYAVRKPRDYKPRQPGDLVQVDTLDVRPLPGTVLKHFTGRDVISRWDVVEVHERATAKTATSFLNTLQARMPFAIRAIQIDGGSEFQADFELACQQRGIHLFALPPRSPKLNGAVERAQRTHTEEFYEVYELPWTATALNPHPLQWEHTYNNVRPHQALGYLTPAEFLAQQSRCDPGWTSTLASLATEEGIKEVSRNTTSWGDRVRCGGSKPPARRRREPGKEFMMNVVLLVVDSLRAGSLQAGRHERPQIPFLSALHAQTTCFRRAYATECWTLPAHLSMFTGLLPSAHGAHFHTMGYTKHPPTLAELLTAAGYHTEVVTRNFVFDGTMPGVTRGFRRNTRLLSSAGSFDLFALFLALAKPRFRQHIQRTGFFHALHRDNRRFLTTFARAMMPADRHTLDYTLEQMECHQRRGTPYFIFCNLYDVHAPYPPSTKSILRPFWSLRGIWENLMFPSVMSCLGAHTYLQPGFRLSEAGRHMLLGRYHRAIELMDAKLADFYLAARGAGLLDNTLLILTSDHGEAFGEHGLYLHDASVYETHLRVPLWIHHPHRRTALVEDVVSTLDLFGLICAVAFGEDCGRTILDPAYRVEHPIVLAEHFHYPRAAGILPRFQQDIVAAIAGNRKVILRREGLEYYDVVQDPGEAAPTPAVLADFEAACRRDGLPARAVAEVADHLRGWHGKQKAFRQAS